MTDRELLIESENPFRQHPGYSAHGCHLQYVVIPAPYASSSHGFGCEVTGGHCLPGERCDYLRAKYPESCGTGEDLMAIYKLRAAASIGKEGK